MSLIEIETERYNDTKRKKEKKTKRQERHKRHKV